MRSFKARLPAIRNAGCWPCWREGIVPLLQMHDCLDCSVSSRKQAELVALLGEEAVKLDVPMRVDLKYGRTWGDAKHTWEELHQTAEGGKQMDELLMDVIWETRDGIQIPISNMETT